MFITYFGLPLNFILQAHLDLTWVECLPETEAGRRGLWEEEVSLDPGGKSCSSHLTAAEGEDLHSYFDRRTQTYLVDFILLLYYGLT